VMTRRMVSDMIVFSFDRGNAIIRQSRTKLQRAGCGWPDVLIRVARFCQVWSVFVNGIAPIHDTLGKTFGETKPTLNSAQQQYPHYRTTGARH
jgi:hypothetical protein